MSVGAASSAAWWEPVRFPNTVYSSGERRCERDGCDTILSRYNGGRECFLHQDEAARQAYMRRHPEAEAA